MDRPGLSYHHGGGVAERIKALDSALRGRGFESRFGQ